MTVSEALQHYTILSIGDGLVSQVPALITSTAAGILITRATAKNDLGRELGPAIAVLSQGTDDSFGHARGHGDGAGLADAAVSDARDHHGLAFLFHSAARHAGIGGPATAAGTYGKPGEAKAPAGAPGEAKAAEKIESLLTLDTLQIELGYGLVTMADTRKGGDLLERVTGVRRNFATRKWAC